MHAIHELQTFLSPMDEERILHSISYTFKNMLYYTQFFPNIFIYVTRNKNYRHSYLLLLKTALKCNWRSQNEIISRENTKRRIQQKKDENEAHA